MFRCGSHRIWFCTHQRNPLFTQHPPKGSYPMYTLHTTPAQLRLSSFISLPQATLRPTPADLLCSLPRTATVSQQKRGTSNSSTCHASAGTSTTEAEAHSQAAPSVQPSVPTSASGDSVQPEGFITPMAGDPQGMAQLQAQVCMPPLYSFTQDGL